MIEIRYYSIDAQSSPFETWFSKLDRQAAAKVTVAITRLNSGNTSNTKSVGSGVFEYRINWGAGYRVYFGFEGAHVVILLTGGTKKAQQKDIDKAKKLWSEYKKQK